MAEFFSTSPADDIYGHRHPIETPQLVEQKLKELDKALEEVEVADKEHFSKALEETEETNTSFKLKFLRCEQFRVDDAAKRLLQYWAKRVEIFGDKAYLPLTQSGALKDEDEYLQRGFVRLLPNVKDSQGRAIIYVDPSRQGEKKERIRTVRALWYVMHAALEEESVQKYGFIMIADPREAKMSQTDTKLDKLNIQSVKGCLPVRIGAMHLCHMPAFFALIWPVVKVFLGAKLRKRIILHNGSVSHVLERLQKFGGLFQNQLPEQLGGSLVVDHKQWLADRKAKGL